ncbi:hemin-degrading factor [Roseobacter sp. HKCCD9010]|uniref:hemin-degrading factor n=1 Tax=unclassified Roseobacter TaxID=196798 RepID=UPI001492ACC9|nr:MULTISPECIES: ChuX/HutX family heme-like substrate-binding protein [unclassified Roseobacter]MBF9051741.1 hemin-degrading factor [Rhodobacterales bacterium HKCCD4356]NNV13734.1 hemin-degrading factor [Roseobacter sp. HKCCD7357]NNV17759.1 hemin-degrading factor [Roseobacter sp. HKCCD8768]NNV27366.1 hemin-degrading factor [Roseobacter sp. HKCCD8192]NNV31486.1 hemin-degrading factor [Roseobacter sp. HKCCD9061]
MGLADIPTSKKPSASDIRAALTDATLRARDLAQSLGVREADLIAAQVGHGATRIAAHPDRLMPATCGLGEVMALTRNDSVVHERTGTYDDWHSGDHAGMILGPEIDLRIFPAHWVHGFALRNESGKGPSRSLQVFDASGEAVHKVYPREGTDLDAWDRAVADLATGHMSDTLQLAPAVPVEGAKSRPDKSEEFRAAWAKMTDTHQFLRLVSRMKMNRLGAYRIAGAPYALPLAPEALNSALLACAAEQVPLMLFVGNRGCIQIHTGQIGTLKEMGPWQNVLDPRFNLHLRLDHVAEVWLVEKPTRRGPALSIEAFTADGALILQLFGYRKEGAEDTEAFARMAADLPHQA